MDATTFAKNAVSSRLYRPRNWKTGLALRKERVHLAEQRAQVAEEALERGQPGARGIDERPETSEELVQIGREHAHLLERGAQLLRHRLQLVDERLGGVREAREPVEREVALALERGQRHERGGQLAVALSRDAEDLVRRRDQIAQRPAPARRVVSAWP